MTTSQASRAIRRLLHAVLPPGGTALTDGQLLARFLEYRDDWAFAALVERHGPLVWGVCRRLLRHHDAEDAFQATFLVLWRKAASVQPRERVANWLYGVAHKTALHARRTTARRVAREKPVTELPERAAREPDLWNDLRPVLDQALGRLPGRYRAVVVLCDLEGRTRKDVARELGVPEGTVASRLARARALLARRLTRRGLAVSGGTLAVGLSRGAASASVPHSVLALTLRVLTTEAGVRSAATVRVPDKVAALTQEVVRSMLRKKLRTVTAVLALACLVAAGIGIRTTESAARPQSAAEPGPAPADPAPPGGKRPAGRSFVVTGRVLDDAGRTPLEGVRVTAHVGWGTLFRVAKAVTDREGRFRLVFGSKLVGSGGKVLPQSAIVWADKPGYFARTYGWPAEYLLTDGPPARGTVLSGRRDYLWPGGEARIEFRMAPAAALRVRLVDAAGKPLAGTSIRLTGDDLPPGWSVLCSGRTDAEGAFVARDVRRGRFRLVIEGREPERRELELGSIEFADAAEYMAEATVYAWTPTQTHVSLKVTRGRLLRP